MIALVTQRIDIGALCCLPEETRSWSANQLPPYYNYSLRSLLDNGRVFFFLFPFGLFMIISIAFWCKMLITNTFLHPSTMQLSTYGYLQRRTCMNPATCVVLWGSTLWESLNGWYILYPYNIRPFSPSR